MQSFLSWVYNQAEKVYDWFGDGYYWLRDAAASALDWAVDEASKALSAAQSYAYNLINNIVDDFWNAIDWLTSKFDDLRQGVIDDISSVTDWVTDKMERIGDFTIDLFWSTIDNISRMISDVDSTIRLLIDDTINYIFGWVSDTYDWILNIRDYLFTLIDTFTSSLLSAIIHFFNHQLMKLTDFIDDPVNFIFDIISEKFISFLCYVIALAIGTTKYELPNRPPWKDR